MSHPGRPTDTELLGRVIGPAGPELTCEACFEHLDRYVEVELAGGDAERAVPGMGAHLEGCPACNEDRDSLLALLRSGPEASGPA
jgi:hypothetical protein